MHINGRHVVLSNILSLGINYFRYVGALTQGFPLFALEEVQVTLRYWTTPLLDFTCQGAVELGSNKHLCRHCVVGSNSYCRPAEYRFCSLPRLCLDIVLCDGDALRRLSCHALRPDGRRQTPDGSRDRAAMCSPVKPRCRGSRAGLPSSCSRCVQCVQANRGLWRKHVLTIRYLQRWTPSTDSSRRAP